MINIPIQHAKQTWKQLEEVHRFGYSYSTIFTDFLDTCLFSLLSLTDNMKSPDIFDKLKENKLTGVYEDGYMQIVGKYKENKSRQNGERPCDYFAEAWGFLLKETKEYGHDILGEIYESQISFGEHGQFFTPVPVCDLMTQLTGSSSSGQAVNDPACGSGRFFISMAKLNKDLHFTGVDISPVCVKMAALNMWLFGLNADIYQGDSLTMKMHQLYKIRKGGYLFEEKVETLPEPVKIQIKQAVEKQTLFDLADFKKKAA